MANNSPTTPTDPTSAAAAALRLSGEMVPARDVEEPGLVLLGKAKTYSENCGSYAPMITASIAAILRVREVMWSAMDQRVMTKSLMSVSDDDGTAWPVSRERELTMIIAKKLQGPANGAADAAEKALRELEQALANGRRKSEFVSLSIGGASQETLARVGLIERELQTKSIESIFDAFDTARTADPELAKLLALAIEPFARTKLATSPAERAAEKAGTATATASSRDPIGKENRVLVAILRAIEEFRVEATDPSLVLSSELFAKLLCPAYRSFCGLGNAWDFPRTGPNAWGEGGKLPDWSERLDDWLTRYMPFGRSDYATVDATTIAKRGGMDGPPGWGPRRKIATGWERQNIRNLVQNPDLPAKVR